MAIAVRERARAPLLNFFVQFMRSTSLSPCPIGLGNLLAGPPTGRRFARRGIPPGLPAEAGAPPRAGTGPGETPRSPGIEPGAFGLWAGAHGKEERAGGGGRGRLRRAPAGAPRRAVTGPGRRTLAPAGIDSTAPSCCGCGVPTGPKKSHHPVRGAAHGGGRGCQIASALVVRFGVARAFGRPPTGAPPSGDLKKIGGARTLRPAHQQSAGHRRAAERYHAGIS